MRKATLASIAVLLVCVLGCGETNRQVFSRYEPQFRASRAQFARIAAALPPAGSVKEDSAPLRLSPRPVGNEKTKTYNTEIVMSDQLLDPDIQRDNRFDLLMSADLLLGIQWTGPKNPMSAGHLDDRAGDLVQRLEQALKYRYLVVVRPASHVRPEAIDEMRFKPGSALLEVFIFDLGNEKLLGALRVAASSREEVYYSASKGADRAAELAESAASSLWENARNNVRQALERATGGEFVFAH